MILIYPLASEINEKNNYKYLLNTYHLFNMINIIKEHTRIDRCIISLVIGDCKSYTENYGRNDNLRFRGQQREMNGLKFLYHFATISEITDMLDSY